MLLRIIEGLEEALQNGKVYLNAQLISYHARYCRSEIALYPLQNSALHFNLYALTVNCARYIQTLGQHATSQHSDSFDVFFDNFDHLPTQKELNTYEHTSKSDQKNRKPLNKQIAIGTHDGTSPCN